MFRIPTHRPSQAAFTLLEVVLATTIGAIMLSTVAASIQVLTYGPAMMAKKASLRHSGDLVLTNLVRELEAAKVVYLAVDFVGISGGVMTGKYAEIKFAIPEALTGIPTSALEEDPNTGGDLLPPPGGTTQYLQVIKYAWIAPTGGATERPLWRVASKNEPDTGGPPATRVTNPLSQCRLRLLYGVTATSEVSSSTCTLPEGPHYTGDFTSSPSVATCISGVPYPPLHIDTIDIQLTIYEDEADDEGYTLYRTVFLREKPKLLYFSDIVP